MRGQKSCSKCREKKSLDEFYYHKHSAQLYPACRKCHIELVVAGQARRKARSAPRPTVSDFIHSLLTRHLETSEG